MSEPVTYSVEWRRARARRRAVERARVAALARCTALAATPVVMLPR